MSSSENNSEHDLRNDQVDVGTLIYEIRIVLEALAHGLKALLGKPNAEPIKGELLILENFATQAIEAMSLLDEPLGKLLALPLECAQPS